MPEKQTKVSTEDCKKALAAAWPAEYGGDALNWKRLSKTGKKGSPIVREFQHKDLPVAATVVEENGAISTVSLRLLGPWDVEDDESGMFDREETTAFLSAHYKPSDFYFFVSDEKEMGSTWYLLAPVSYWKTAGALYDQELGPYVAKILPNGEVDEAQESTFCSEMEPDALRAELTRLGFLHDDEFDACFKPSEPSQ